MFFGEVFALNRQVQSKKKRKTWPDGRKSRRRLRALDDAFDRFQVAYGKDCRCFRERRAVAVQILLR